MILSPEFAIAAAALAGAVTVVAFGLWLARRLGILAERDHERTR